MCSGIGILRHSNSIGMSQVDSVVTFHRSEPPVLGRTAQINRYNDVIVSVNREKQYLSRCFLI